MEAEVATHLHAAGRSAGQLPDAGAEQDLGRVERARRHHHGARLTVWRAPLGSTYSTPVASSPLPRSSITIRSTGQSARSSSLPRAQALWM